MCNVSCEKFETFLSIFTRNENNGILYIRKLFFVREDREEAYVTFLCETLNIVSNIYVKRIYIGDD